MHVVFFIFVLYEIFLACVVFVLYAGCKKNREKNDVLYFSARGTRSGILCCIFRTWNALWYYCVIFSARGTHSGVIVLYFSACRTRSSAIVLEFPAGGTLFSIIVLYFPCVELALVLLCSNFQCVERALALLCYILRMWNVIWRYCVIFYARGIRFGIFC